MTARRHRRNLTAWLALAATFLMGLAPAQGLVLCVEPDGSTSLEFAVAGDRCGGCDSTGATDEATDCPCVDIPVVACSDRLKVASKPISVDHATLLVVRLSPWVTIVRRVVEAPPQVASGPRLIRSVVLLV